MGKFALKLALFLQHKPFNMEGALELSTEIHEAEANGYELTKMENRRWERLTAMIEATKTEKRIKQ